MHEMSYCIRIVQMALDAAKEHELNRIRRLTVEVGEMTGVLPYYLKLYFPEAARGTILEETTLDIIEVSVSSECEDCKKVYHPDRENGYCCPVCGSHRAKLLAGREVSIRNMEGD